jgi:hypothetical protein
VYEKRKVQEAVENFIMRSPIINILHEMIEAHVPWVEHILLLVTLTAAVAFLWEI